MGELDKIFRTGGLEIEDAGIRAGEIVGYRAWRLPNPDEPYLYSITLNFRWERENGPARQNGRKPTSKLFDGGQYTRGYYAFKSPTVVKWQYHNPYTSFVVGRVHLWGIVIEHEFGYRAEFARIVAIDGTINPKFDLRRSDYYHGRSFTKFVLPQIREYYGV